MKINFDKPNTVKNTSFEGYKPVKSDYGYNEYEFNYPFDDSKFDCYLELSKVKLDDESGNYTLTAELKNKKAKSTALKLNSGANKINLSAHYSLPEGTAFAYHYKLVPKNTDGKGIPMYQVDAGDVIDFTKPNENKDYEKIYNLVVPNGSKGSTGGAMMLIVPDSYNAMYTFDKDGKYLPNLDYINAAKSVKTFSNKIGGSLAGVERDLDAGKFDGLAKIISTPLFTDDSLTPHAYWNKNCMQMAQSLGSVEDYSRLQRKLFAHGINWVSDGALVNEGLEGVHFQHVLKWGKESPYYKWFSASALEKGPLSLGVFSDKTGFIAHKIVNSPWKFTQDSNGQIKWKSIPHDKNKPIYIQVFDKRLVNNEQLNDNSLIEGYSKRNTDNIFDIVTHNDTIIPYKFEIEPEAYLDNIKKFNGYNKKKPAGKYIPYNSFEATRILTQFKNFQLDAKFESGFKTWDANADIAKLNYVYSHANSKDVNNLEDVKQKAEVKELKENNMEVQDYAIASAQHWTKLTNQVLSLHVAKNLQNVDDADAAEVNKQIQENINVKKVFPASLNSKIDTNVIQNVLDGTYKLKGAATVEDFKTVVKSNLMDVPFDSIELGDNIVSVLGSSYISKRAHHSDELGKSRFYLDIHGNPHLNEKNEEIYKTVNEMFYPKDGVTCDKNGEFYTFSMNVLKSVNQKLPESSKLNSGYNTSTYGKYVVPLLAQEIMKFAVVKGLVPNAEVSIDKENGGIKYNYKELKGTSLQGLGINATSAKKEATELISKLGRGVAAIKEEDKELLANALYKMIEGTNLTSFELAEMIVDRSQAGLDWRIDATKDIGDVDSLRNKDTDFQTTWDDVIGFWNKFTQEGVYKYNPNAYMVAEVTNEDELFDTGHGKNSSRYSDRKEVFMKFLKETGIMSTANYRYFFTDVASIFTKSWEKDENKFEGTATRMIDIMKDGWNGERNEPTTGFLHSGPLDSLLYSYTFVDNHDKPRALHGLSMDMGLFYADLGDSNNDVNKSRRMAAYKVFQNKYKDNVNYHDINNYNFSLKSPKAAAMGDALMHGFDVALNDLHKSQPALFANKDEIYGKLTEAISSLANGYVTVKEGGKKEFSADGFGVIPYDIAINKVIEEAGSTGLVLSQEQKDFLRKSTFCTILKPGMQKMKGIMQFLVAAPGNPTIYAGDDFGSTGYEQKTKNIYLQNRNVLHHEWLENGSESLGEIKKYKKEIDEIMALRSRYELHALNDGAPFLLPEQRGTKSGDSNDNDYSEKLSAMLRQSTDGSMTISVFNTKGATHEYKDYNGDKNVYMGAIDITPPPDGKSLRGGITPGTVFVNAKNENQKFVVKYEQKDGKDHYFVVPEHGGKIHVDDYTLILYHASDDVIKKAKELKDAAKALKAEPKDTNLYDVLKQRHDEKLREGGTSFTGGIRLYNPQYNIVSNPYTQNKKVETGSRLALLSK